MEKQNQHYQRLLVSHVVGNGKLSSTGKLFDSTAGEIQERKYPPKIPHCVLKTKNSCLA